MKDEPANERTFSRDELAELCGLPVRVLGRFIDRELLVPQRGGERFPFRAVGAARVLAQLWSAGWNAGRIERAWRLARTVVADPEAALTGLLASIGQRRVLVRSPDGRLLEPGGQLLFDFGASAGPGAVHAPLPALRSAQDWFAIGVDAEAAGRLEDAVRAYEHALPGGSGETHFNLGNCLYALRRRPEACAHFATAVELAPDYAEAWNNLGIVRGELGDRAGAKAALQCALELVPHYADAHYNLAEALAVVGDMDGARRHWRAYLAFDPNSRWAEQVRRRLAANGG